ncbi:type II secretion system F family protein [Kiloniella laminariae]|uniref:type II secretion system F family protein n=1 Tax=Kiloniella laminariae TaxID=454162 RepID=UPI00037B1E5D|nr:type II secretion system F family protein [Kiloniella laminariae]
MNELLTQILTGQVSDITLLTLLSGVMFILLVILFFILNPSSDISKTRLERVIHKAADGRSTAASNISIRRNMGGSGNPTLDKIVQQLTPRPELLRAKMQKAGLEPNLGRLLLISILLSISAIAIINVFSSRPLIVSILLGFAIGFGFPHFVLYVMKNRRQNKFLELFPDAIDLMVRGLRAGLPITEAIKNAGDEISAPVGFELAAVTDGVKLGGKLPQELERAQYRIGLQEFQFFTVALSIQTETGGNLAETLANLSDILRKRKQMKLKIKALSSEARASAYIIGSLPFIMFVIIYLMTPSYALELFTDPRGQAAVAFGLFMIALGSGIMYKMVKFEI